MPGAFFGTNAGLLAYSAEDNYRVEGFSVVERTRQRLAV